MKLTDKERFDLAEELCRAEENSRAKALDEQERKLIDKALKKDMDNMKYLNRAFPYLTEEHLIDTITGLYPDLNEIIIVNLDKRDAANIPLLKTKNFRTIKIHHTRTTYTGGYYSGRSECRVDVKIKLLLAVIENGTVYIKSTRIGNSQCNNRIV